MGQVKTFPLPPAADLSALPEDMFSCEEVSLLRLFLSATLRTRGKDEFEKAIGSWTDEARATVASMLSLLRGKGFYPDRIGTGGEIVWGIALKSRVQMALERNADRYQLNGEVMAGHGVGSLAAAMRGRSEHASQG